MAAPSALTALRVPGAVTVDGVAIGLLARVELRRTTRRPTIVAEEFGSEIVDELWTGAAYRLGMALRGWDHAAIGKLFPSVSNRRVTWPGSGPIGRLRSRDAVAVVFTPRYSGAPTITFASAIPEVAEDLVVRYAKQEEHLIMVSFLALRDGATPAGSVTWGP